MAIRKPVLATKAAASGHEPLQDSDSTEPGRAAGISSGGRKNGTGKLSKYDPGQFRVPGTDHQGHSRRIFCRVMPAVDHQIDQIISSKNFPFSTRGDFMRWAIWESIKRLDTMEPVPNSFINVAEIMIESARNAQFWEKFKTSIEMTRQAVEMYIQTNNEQEALKMVSRCRAWAMKIEEDVWRNQYLKELDDKFGYLFERNKGKAVKLMAAEK